jgi:hypothetical protein
MVLAAAVGWTTLALVLALAIGYIANRCSCQPQIAVVDPDDVAHAAAIHQIEVAAVRQGIHVKEAPKVDMPLHAVPLPDLPGVLAAHYSFHLPLPPGPRVPVPYLDVNEDLELKIWEDELKFTKATNAHFCSDETVVNRMRHKCIGGMRSTYVETVRNARGTKEAETLGLVAVNDEAGQLARSRTTSSISPTDLHRGSPKGLPSVERDEDEDLDQMLTTTMNMVDQVSSACSVEVQVQSGMVVNGLLAPPSAAPNTSPSTSPVSTPNMVRSPTRFDANVSIGETYSSVEYARGNAVKRLPLSAIPADEAFTLGPLHIRRLVNARAKLGATSAKLGATRGTQRPQILAERLSPVSFLSLSGKLSWPLQEQSLATEQISKQENARTLQFARETTGLTLLDRQQQMQRFLTHTQVNDKVDGVRIATLPGMKNRAPYQICIVQV